jgi:uroporphyrin-III C-methyltransferase
MNSKLTLVGAGPGDPELLTLKAINALATADVVLYDALVNEQVLKFAPNDSIKIFVGKKKGVCQFPQEQINDLIVAYCAKYKHVVRLKGGDPFIFGRGHEELVVARQKGIDVVVIPGISSAVAIATLQEIPLTRRGINDSFWVVTGTTKEHQLSKDIIHAANSDATVVVLMGMSQLDKICEVFHGVGKFDLPVAIIQNGSTEQERVLVSNIREVCSKVEEEGLGSPAIIIIGEVVNLHPSVWKHEVLHCI